MKLKFFIYTFSCVISIGFAHARFTCAQEENGVKLLQQIRKHLPFLEKDQAVKDSPKKERSDCGRVLKRTKAYYGPAIKPTEFKRRKGGAVSPRVNDRRRVTAMAWEEQVVSSPEEIAYKIYLDFMDKNFSALYPLFSKPNRNLTVLGLGCNFMLENVLGQVLIDTRYEDGHRHIHLPIPNFEMSEAVNEES